MPNPYHDDQGRFCSAGEMSASIARLTEKGDFYVAQKMNEEFTRYQIIGAKTPDEKRVADLKNKLTASAWTDSELQPGGEGEKNLALSIIATQNSSNADIVQALKEVKTERNEAEETLISIQKQQDEINSKIVSESNNRYKNMAEVNDEAWKDHTIQETFRADILKTLKQKMVEAGIPRNYVNSYFERKLPVLGFGFYINNFNRKVVPSEKPYPVSADSKVWNSTTKPAEYKTIIKEVVAEAEKEGVFTLYNNKLEAGKQRDQIIGTYNETYNGLTREARKLEQDNAKRATVISRLEKIQAWRKTLKEKGISEYSTLLPARSIEVSKVTKDSDGKINNLQGLTHRGEIERIVKVVPTGYGHPESGLLVGENDGRYVSSTHYANYKTSSTDRYVIFDPTVKGAPYFDKNSEIKTFYNQIDSGD